MLRSIFMMTLVAGWLGHPAAAAAPQNQEPRKQALEVVATIPDLADICVAIGGDAVRVKTLVPAGNDPHAVLPKASLLLQLQRSDILLLMGLDYEHAFLPPLLEKVRNPRVLPDGEGYVNVSARIRALEVPANLDRGAGADLHPRGNPHFNLDPERVRVAALAVRDALIAADPGRREQFSSAWQEWDRKLAKRLDLWEAYLKPLQGKPLVSYHRSWSYFADRFELELLGEVEPKPGLRPSPRHLAELATSMRDQQARVLLMEPWYPRSGVEKLLQITAAELVVCATTCGATRDTMHYIDWMDHLVEHVGRAYGRPTLAAFEAERAGTPDE